MCVEGFCYYARNMTISRSSTWKFRVWYPAEKKFYHAYIETSYGILGKDAWNEKYEIQMSIGLTDVSYNDIYEGDILRNQAGRTFVVGWCHKGFEYKEIAEVNGKKGIQPYWVNNIGDESLCQVIGNIHNNPELLK